MELIDYVRLINIGIAIVCVVGMISVRHWWLSKPRHERFLLLSLAFLVLATGYSLAESIIQDLPFGSRVLIYTPSLLFCLYGIYGLRRKVREILKREQVKEDIEKEAHHD